MTLNEVRRDTKPPSTSRGRKNAGRTMTDDTLDHGADDDSDADGDTAAGSKVDGDADAGSEADINFEVVDSEKGRP